MLPLVLVILTAQPGVVLGTGLRASTVLVGQVTKVKADEPGTALVMSTDVISPNWGQRWNTEALRAIRDATLGEAVTVELRTPDEELRTLGAVETVTAFGRIRMGKVYVHELLLKQGLAWVLPSARGDAALVKLEAEARAAKKGLWADADPVEPWLWAQQLLLRDDETKVVHSGWDCPHVKTTQCHECGGGRFWSLAESADAGFTRHTCLSGEALRFANASGVATLVERSTDNSAPTLPAAARRSCTKDSECAVAPLPPCSCGSCETTWLEPATRSVVSRMKANYARVSCSPPPCIACAGRVAGAHSTCREGQCVIAE
ncbi:MAG: thermonuclease family protein [Archangiaceae bacterium]|nr:thermonuclease family protein [Archangiaceae bacterium]